MENRNNMSRVWDLEECNDQTFEHKNTDKGNETHFATKTHALGSKMPWALAALIFSVRRSTRGETTLFVRASLYLAVLVVVPIVPLAVTSWPTERSEDLVGVAFAD